MLTHRANALREAEKLLQQGRLDAAIAAYARVVEQQPRDWNSANLLGDLYIRVGQPEKAIGQWVRIADSLADEGFLSKASALYRKVLKLRPDHEHARLRAADIAIGQELTVDARAHLKVVLAQRQARGDEWGAAEIAARLTALDGDDVPTRTSGRVAGRPIEVEKAPVVDASPSDAGDQPAAIVDDSLFASPAAAIDLERPATEEAGDEVDLTMLLDTLPDPVSPTVPGGRVDLESVFEQLRSRVRSDADVESADDAYAKGLAAYEAGEMDICVPALDAACRAPHLRFAAASLLGRISRSRGMIGQAVDYLERAAEAPAPSLEEGRRLLYELADALEAAGERARALAVFLELRADVGQYRDVGARIDRLLTT